MKLSGRQVPIRFERFTFKGNQYTTQHMAVGMFRPVMQLEVRAPGKSDAVEGFSFGLFPRERNDGSWNYFYPGEVVNPSINQDGVLTTASHENQFETEAYDDPHKISSWPKDVRDLINRAWHGGLLRMDSDDEGLFFKDRGASVVLNNIKLLETLSGPVDINHVVLLLGEREDVSVKPRHAAKLILSHFTAEDIFASLKEKTLGQLSFDVAMSKTTP